MNKFTIKISTMLQYIFSSFVCIHLVLLQYNSAEDCRYQLLLSSSCYIDNGSLSDVNLPCTIETCGNADYMCDYNGTGQDFSYLVFYCNTSSSEKLNCTFRRTSWKLYSNLTALFNVCLINEASCNILTNHLANCVLNSYSTTSKTTEATSSTSTVISVITTSKIVTSGTIITTTLSPLSTSTSRATTTEWVNATLLESAITTLNNISASPTKNVSQPLQPDMSTIPVSSHSDIQEANENNNLIIGLPVAFGIAFLILTLVFVVAFVRYKRKKSRSRKKTNALNTQLNHRSSQNPILATETNSDADSQGYTVNYANHQPEQKTQNDVLSVYTNENSISSHYSRFIDSPRDVSLTRTMTHSEPELVQYSLVKKTHNNDGSEDKASVQSGYTSNNMYGNSSSILLTEKDTTNQGKKPEVQTQVNYSKLFEVSRESSSEYAEVSLVKQIDNQSVHL